MLACNKIERGKLRAREAAQRNTSTAGLFKPPILRPSAEREQTLTRVDKMVEEVLSLSHVVRRKGLRLYDTDSLCLFPCLRCRSELLSE